MDDLKGNNTRLEFLDKQVAASKKNLMYWQELRTHEVCLLNGQHYPIKKTSE